MKGAAAVLCTLLAGLSAACAGGADVVQPVASRSCSTMLYEGDGEPDAVIVSDLPLRGIGAETSKLMVDAVELVLRRREFRAGDFRIGYQSCNDTIGDEPFDAGLCRRNVRTYVAHDAVLGAIGPWNSGCAFEQIPVASRGDAGPLALVSPSNTNPQLTRTADAASLYPDGQRSYFRVVTHDLAQGIAAAHLAKRLGARKAVVLHQDLAADQYVRFITESFLGGARAIGLETVSMDWAIQDRYRELASAVRAEQPDVVYLAGLTVGNARTLVEDLRAALPNRVRLVAPESFAFTGIAEQLGSAGEGLLVTVPGVPAELLPPAGRRFVRELGRAAVIERGQLGAAEAAQAAEVLLDAIARSDGTRASVVEELHATKVEDGILGCFSFDRFGDIDPAPVGVYRFESGKIVARDLVRAPLDSLRGP